MNGLKKDLANARACMNETAQLPPYPGTTMPQGGAWNTGGGGISKVGRTGFELSFSRAQFWHSIGSRAREFVNHDSEVPPWGTLA